LIALLHRSLPISEKVNSCKPDSEIEQARVFAKPSKAGFPLDAGGGKEEYNESSSNQPVCVVGHDERAASSLAD